MKRTEISFLLFLNELKHVLELRNGFWSDLNVNSDRMKWGMRSICEYWNQFCWIRDSNFIWIVLIGGIVWCLTLNWERFLHNFIYCRLGNPRLHCDCDQSRCMRYNFFSTEFIEVEIYMISIQQSAEDFFSYLRNRALVHLQFESQIWIADELNLYFVHLNW